MHVNTLNLMILVVKTHSQSTWTSLVDLFLAVRATHVFLDWPLWRTLLLLTKRRMPIFAVLPKHYILEPQNSSIQRSSKAAVQVPTSFSAGQRSAFLQGSPLLCARIFALAGQGQSFLSCKAQTKDMERSDRATSDATREREREREGGREREREREGDKEKERESEKDRDRDRDNKEKFAPRILRAVESFLQP